MQYTNIHCERSLKGHDFFCMFANIFNEILLVSGALGKMRKSKQLKSVEMAKPIVFISDADGAGEILFIQCSVRVHCATTYK